MEISKKMLDLKLRQDQILESLQKQKEEERIHTKVKLNKTNQEHTENIRNQGKLPLYHLGMLALCQVLGIALNENTQKLFWEISKKNLETIGVFFQSHGDKFANVIKEMLDTSYYRSPQHRLQYEEMQEQQLEHQIEYFMQNQDKIMERIINSFQTILQFEKQIVAP